MADTKKTRHAREQRRLAKGLCQRCGKQEHEKEKKHCSFCLEYQAARMSTMWKRREDAGLCTKCGKNPPQKKRKWCVGCRSSKQREKRLARNKGACSGCGSNIPEPGYKCCQRCLDTQTRYRKRIRNEALEAYGGPICSCCGETEPLFLAINHIEDGGNEHRRRVGKGGSLQFLQWLRKENYPDGFQILCQNCNWGKHVNENVCPHRATDNI